MLRSSLRPVAAAAAVRAASRPAASASAAAAAAAQQHAARVGAKASSADEQQQQQQQPHAAAAAAAAAAANAAATARLHSAATPAVANDKLANHNIVEMRSDGTFPTEKWDKYRVDDEGAYRNFSYFVLGAGGAGLGVGAKNAVTSFLSTMSASSDVLALSNIEVDLNTVPEGETVTVTWRGKPLFIRHRTAAEIEKAEATDLGDLKDPETDDARRQRAEWMIVLGICTHLGCVPLNNAGDWGGWFCPCHGSHYDVSGRIMKGPAPLNLEVPPYKFIDDETLFVGD